MLARALLVAFVLLPQDPPAPALQVQGFHYRAGALAVGRVLHYKKSNLDGSHATEIALYLASETRLEALKYDVGGDEATLVVAELDWEVFSVRSFHTWRLAAGKQRELVAELATSPDRRKLTAQVGGLELECELPGFPWHSYDFDFASLNAALPFLAEPEGECELEIVDPVQGGDTPRLAAKGKVVLAYDGDEKRGELDCRRYLLDGPGLEDRGGSAWVTKGEQPFLAAFELDLPDEPGMKSGKLEWQRTETMTGEAWHAFVERLGQQAK